MINLKVFLNIQDKILFVQHRDGMWYTLYEGKLIPNKGTEGAVFDLNEHYKNDGSHIRWESCDIVKVMYEKSIILDYSVTE